VQVPVVGANDRQRRAHRAILASGFVRARGRLGALSSAWRPRRSLFRCRLSIQSDALGSSIAVVSVLARH
jgi:hypothetical protein